MVFVAYFGIVDKSLPKLSLLTSSDVKWLLVERAAIAGGIANIKKTREPLIDFSFLAVSARGSLIVVGAKIAFHNKSVLPETMD